MDQDALSREVDQNYDYFQRHASAYLPGEIGRYALIRRKRIVGFYDDPGAAASEGKARFVDDLFSIHEVTDAPIDLGLYTYAAN